MQKRKSNPPWRSKLILQNEKETSPGKLGSAKNHQQMRFRSNCNENTVEPSIFCVSRALSRRLPGWTREREDDGRRAAPGRDSADKKSQQKVLATTTDRKEGIFNYLLTPLQQHQIAFFQGWRHKNRSYAGKISQNYALYVRFYVAISGIRRYIILLPIK